jgi:hypothetical protein
MTFTPIPSAEGKKVCRKAIQGAETGKLTELIKAFSERLVLKTSAGKISCVDFRLGEL